MRKKIQKATAVALAATMTVGLAACGGGSETKETGKTEKKKKYKYCGSERDRLSHHQ